VFDPISSEVKRKPLAMRTIPFFLISLGLMVAACTTEPKRPDDPTPATVCTEECSKDADCWGGNHCSKDKLCIPPGSDTTHCATAADCNGTCKAGFCAPCTDDASCKGNAAGGKCDPAAGTCGECVADADCKTSKNGHACGGGVCTECTTDEHCVGNKNGAICDPNSGTCKCDTDKVCETNNPGMHLGLCRAEGCVCSGNQACTTGAKKCSQGLDGKFTGVCVACEKDADCAADADPMTPDPSKCFKADDPLSAFCGCTKNDECAAGKLCDTMTGKCLACLADADCKGDPAGEICTDGKCHQCDPGHDKDGKSPDCMSTHRGDTCDPSGDVPVCVCSASSQCMPNITNTNLQWVCE